jgi:allophanate hydrolase subunit 2
VGIRLTGPTLRRRTDGELPSQGLVRGAVQLPPSGELVVFLADHPVTGGYPVIGVLTQQAADRAAQLRPGDVVAFAAAPG